MGDPRLPGVDAGKPLPLPDAATAGYWAAAREHRLALQHCLACALFIHSPALLCPRCDSQRLEFREVSGRGRLYAYTVMHDAPTRGFEAMLPYAIGIVELEEQDRLMLVTNIVAAPPQSLHIGMPLEVVFEDISADCALPQFRPAGA